MNGPDDDEMPEQTSDDTSVGWGDDVAAEVASDTDEWYLSERPPHHGT